MFKANSTNICEHCGKHVPATIEASVCGDSLELCPDCYREHTVNPVPVKGKLLKDEQPAHYAGHKYDALDVAIEWDLNFIEGNILKYLFRYKKKNGLEDLKKMLHYSNRLYNEFLKKGK